MKRSICALALVLASAALPARADVYAYVDGEGVAHFAAEKLDARYRLYARGDRFAPLTARALDTGRAPADFIEPSALKAYTPLLEKASREFAVDLALIKAIVTAESGFDPAAVSPKGAIGLMQVMPATAERYGVVGDRRASLAQKLRDPRVNVRVGTRYLADLLRLFPGEPQLAIAAYNAGEGAVQQYDKIPPYRETRAYVARVSALHSAYQPPLPSQQKAAKLRGRAADAGKRLMMVIEAPRNAAGSPAASAAEGAETTAPP